MEAAKKYQNYQKNTPSTSLPPLLEGNFSTMKIQINQLEIW